MQYTVGIDEVGRGPLAGPVAVCAVQWLSSTPPEDILADIRDSKKTTAKNREAWLLRAQHLGDYLAYAVHFSHAEEIDTQGIIGALATAAEQSLYHLNNRNRITHVYADYGLPIPKAYPHTSIVKGDESNPLISLASIIAKVLRDDLLCRYDCRFPRYYFSKNKGYGTAAHREALNTYGMSPIHRRTFLKNNFSPPGS